MNTTSWRQALDRAIERNGSLPQARYVQLATIRSDGRPANRTLVFRGFLAESDRLCFTTDLRSAKVEQLAAVPWAEACWFFPQTLEQFRLLGRVVVVTGQSEDAGLRQTRETMWQGLRAEQQATFAWPVPGMERAGEEAFAVKPPDPRQPPLSFGLLVLEPDEVDHLELRDSPHPRHHFQRSGGGDWVRQILNP